MENKIPAYLLKSSALQDVKVKVKRAKLSFLDKTLLNSAKALKSMYLQSENAARENSINKINPHVKLISLIYLAAMISFVNNLHAQLLTAAFIFCLYIISGLRVFQVYRRILSLAFIFGFLILLPASLNMVTPGKIILKIISFKESSEFLIYHIPKDIGITDNGVQVVSLVFLRVFNSLSFAFLIISTTPFASFIKSFRIIGIPDAFLMIISLAYKYIFILSRTIEETYIALKSRLTGNIKSRNIRKLVSGRIFFIFKKSMIIYENTYYAMLSRGYSGRVKLYSQEKLTLIDIVALVAIAAWGIVIILY